jgi:glycosyltransferase involved in cell wall biosynthesis
LNLPLVSIVVPSYNVEPYLSECLQSALDQTYHNIEIIVVDDGSKDLSLEIAQTFAGPRCKVIAQENSGAGNARNHGVQEAQGTFIQFLDADDVLHPRKIEFQMEQLLRIGAPDVIASSSFWGFTDFVKNAQRRELAINKHSHPVDFIVCSWLGGGWMQINGWLTPRTLIEAAGPWTNRKIGLNDDGEFFTRVLLASTRIEFCKEAISYYRKHPSRKSLSGHQSREAIETLLWSLEVNSKRLLAVEKTERTIEACHARLVDFAIAQYPEFPDLAERVEKFLVQIGAKKICYTSDDLLTRLSYVIGWKATRTLQHYVRRVRYR